MPVPLAGEGVRALIRQALELATTENGLVLIEEPEVHLHPAAIWQSASAIVEVVRRKVQVVVSTHSLEFIDAVLANLKDAEFVGREAYEQQRSRPPVATLCTLTVDDPTSSSGVRRYMLGREPVLDLDGQRIVDAKGRGSYVTSDPGACRIPASICHPVPGCSL